MSQGDATLAMSIVTCLTIIVGSWLNLRRYTRLAKRISALEYPDNGERK